MEQFRTGWFIESVASASLIVLAIRSKRSLITARPSKYLLLATILAVVTVVCLPYTIVGKEFEFVPIPIPILIILAIIVTGYITSVEIAKRSFYKKVKM